MTESFTVGDVTIGVVVDLAPPPFDPTSFFPDVSPGMWEPYKQEHLDKDGMFQTNFCAWIIRSGEHTILVDTGLGPGPHQAMGGNQGQLIPRLREMGIGPGDISTVVITHLHGDHIGWNVSDEGGKKKATFPRAKYLVPKGDWDHFTSPEILPSQPSVQTNAIPLQSLGALELVGDAYAVTPEVTTLSTPGHTPGHTSLIVNSQGEKAIVVGDLFHSSVQVPEADWCAGADMDKDVARKSRHAVLDRLEQEGFIVAASHLPVGRSIGRIVRLEGLRYWQVL